LTDIVSAFQTNRTRTVDLVYWPRTNLRVVKDEKGDLLADSHSMLNRCKIHLCQLLNIHGVNGVRQTAIHTVESLVPEPSATEVEMAIEKLKCYQSPGVYQIPAELIQAGGKVKCFDIHKLSVVYLE
jgi:hypothetical protein